MTACSPLDKIKSIIKDDGAGYIFKVSLSSDPINLDPQLCQDESSIAVAKNLFVGLMKYDAEKGLTPAVATDYSVSPDGHKYTFTLDNRYKWRSVGDYEADLTAHDFVFAFRRLFDPKTKSPYAKDYFCISCAQMANSGALPVENVGVTALDDYTLEFVLDYPNAQFLSLLSRLPASPCNEGFFNDTKGKYGLEAESIASNGPFYVRYWLYDPYGKDNYVRLRRNQSYSEISRVYPTGVNFLIEKDLNVRLNDFTSGTTDVFVSNSLSGDLCSDSERELTNEKYYLSSCGLIINPKEEILSRPEVKDALSLCINRRNLENSTPDYMTAACGLIPDEAYVGSTKYRSNSNEQKIEENQSLAEYKWNFILNDNEKSRIQGTNILVPSSFSQAQYLSLVTSEWKDVLGLNIGIEIVSDKDYRQRVEDKDYSILLTVLSSDYANAFDYIEPFADGEFGISIESCRKAIYKSVKYNTVTAAIYDISVAESEVIESYVYMPLWFVPKFVYTGEDNTDIEYDIFSGSLLFENAKHF